MNSAFSNEVENEILQTPDISKFYLLHMYVAIILIWFVRCAKTTLKGAACVFTVKHLPLQALQSLNILEIPSQTRQKDSSHRTAAVIA